MEHGSTGGQPGHIDGTEALNTGSFMGVHAGIESTGAGAGEQLWLIYLHRVPPAGQSSDRQGRVIPVAA